MSSSDGRALPRKTTCPPKWTTTAPKKAQDFQRRITMIKAKLTSFRLRLPGPGKRFNGDVSSLVENPPHHWKRPATTCPIGRPIKRNGPKHQ